MKQIRLIIAGSRNFTDYDYLERKLDQALSGWDYEQIEIVSGACKGVDLLGERYAKENGLPVKSYPADWDKYGRGAGFKRNYAMAEYATHCIVFQVGESKGSQHMIDIATKKGLPLTVCKLDQTDNNILPVMSGRQDILKLTTTNLHRNYSDMTFSNKNIGWDLPCYPKDKEAPIFLWRKRFDQVESISKIEFDKAKFISIPQGIVCLFECTFPPAGVTLDLTVIPYIAILLHGVEYKAYNFDTKKQDVIQPTKGELAYIDFLKTNGFVDSDDLYSDGYFRYISDVDVLKENTKFAWDVTYFEGDQVLFEGINTVAKFIKDGCGATNGNGKTFVPKQTPKERLAEVKPLVLAEMLSLSTDDDLMDLLKETKMTSFEYLTLLFK